MGLSGLSCDVDRDVCPSLLIDKVYLFGASPAFSNLCSHAWPDQLILLLRPGVGGEAGICTAVEVRVLQDRRRLSLLSVSACQL